MKLKNKIFLIFFILFVFVLFFNISNVFAKDFTSETGYAYSYPDEMLEIIYNSEYYNSNYYCTCFKSTLHGKYYVNFIEKTDTLQITFNRGDKFIANEEVNYYSFVYSTSDFSFIESSGLLSNKTYSSEALFGNQNSSNVFYIDNGTYYTSSGELFFQVPVTEIPATTVPALETVEQIPGAMIQTLKIIIPVGLVLFGIGLVVYLIRRILF